MAREGSRGLTLLEMVVVLVLLGVALALSFPSLVPPRAATDDPLQRVLDDARRFAVRRAEPLSLAIEADGRWTLEASDRLAPEIIRSGQLDGTRGAALRVLVSPLGACWIEGSRSAGAPPTLDPALCRLSGGSS